MSTINSALTARNEMLRRELLRLDPSSIVSICEAFADPRVPARAEVLHHARALSTAIVKLRMQLAYDHPMQRAFRGELTRNPDDATTSGSR